MCKPLAEGGQRCAAHTRPAYEAATPGTAEWDEAAAAYASTPTGTKELQEELARADESHIKALSDASAIREWVKAEHHQWTKQDADAEQANAEDHLRTAQGLENALKRGSALRERAGEVKAAIQDRTPAPTRPPASPCETAILSAINDPNDAAMLTFDEGAYPGTVTVTSKYEGLLLDSADRCAAAGLYVHLKDGDTVYGDEEDGFTITVSQSDQYGHSGYWRTGDLD